MPTGVYLHKKRPLRYEVDEKTGCWNGLGYIKPTGYPTHLREFYEKQKGKIPEGLHLDHLCRNRRCINAEHLEPVTPAENTHRSSLVKLNWEKVNFIRKSVKQGESLRGLAKKMGINYSSIWKIIHNKQWKICALSAQ